jgi:hypothetical protein
VESPVSNGRASLFKCYYAVERGDINMFGKFIVGSITGLSLLGLLSGCAGADDQASKKMSPSPSPTVTETDHPTPTETDIDNPAYEPRLDYTEDIVLAKNDVELEFLTISLASCEKAQTDGFIAETAEGESIFRSDTKSGWPFWPFAQVSIIDGKPVFGENEVLFNIYWPAVFDPCDLEAAARTREPEDVYLEHKVTKINDNSYKWAQHKGGANLDELIYEVTDGLISGYAPNKTYATKISYGPLTATQIALLDQAAK